MSSVLTIILCYEYNENLKQNVKICLKWCCSTPQAIQICWINRFLEAMDKLKHTKTHITLLFRK